MLLKNINNVFVLLVSIFTITGIACVDINADCADEFLNPNHDFSKFFRL